MILELLRDKSHIDNYFARSTVRVIKTNFQPKTGDHLCFLTDCCWNLSENSNECYFLICQDIVHWEKGILARKTPKYLCCGPLFNLFLIFFYNLNIFRLSSQSWKWKEKSIERVVVLQLPHIERQRKIQTGLIWAKMNGNV